MADFTPTSKVCFTLPGKLGDNLARLPIAYRYARVRDTKVDIFVDQYSAKALIPLLSSLPWVNAAHAATGIVHDGCGGQPFDFGAPKWFEEQYDEVYHLGYRHFPQGNLTYESVPPGWPRDLAEGDLLSERPLGVSWDAKTWESKGRRVMLTAKSSRPQADRAAALTYHNAYPHLTERGLIASDGDVGIEEHPLMAVASLFSKMLVVTTYSAMCQLAALVGAPCVVLIPPQGYGLGHYDSRIPWYPGWQIATEGDAEGLVAAVDRAIEAALGRGQDDAKQATLA